MSDEGVCCVGCFLFDDTHSSVVVTVFQLSYFYGKSHCLNLNEFAFVNFGTYQSRRQNITYRIYSIKRPGRLLNFWTLKVGAYSRWALIRGWALNRINTVYIYCRVILKNSLNSLLEGRGSSSSEACCPGRLCCSLVCCWSWIDTCTAFPCCLRPELLRLPLR